MKKSVTQKQIDFASNVNLVDFLTEIGEPIVHVGHSKYYNHAEHDSLVINDSKNTFIWNSRSSEKNSNGNAINYLMIMRGMDFKEAVLYINGQDVEVKHIVRHEAHVKNFDPMLLKTVLGHTDRIYQYLCGKRQINHDLIKMLILRNLIKLDDHNNVVFLWAAAGNVVGADKQGTIKMENSKSKRDYFKMVVPTTKEFSDYGFNVHVNGDQVENLYLFESPVDLLIFLSLHKGQLKNSWLVSMNGLKVKTVLRTIKISKDLNKTLGGVLKHVYLSVDNDKPGCDFVAKMDNYTYLNGFEEETEFETCLPEKRIEAKKVDWNDKLTGKEE